MKHKVEEYNLINGSKLLAINAPNQDVVSLKIAVRTGTNYVGKDNYEIAHLLEHIMFNGNKDYPDKDDFNYELEKSGSYHNGFTGSTVVAFEYATTNENIINVISLALAQLAKPIISKENVALEKSIIEREIEPSLDNPYRVCNLNLRKIVSTAHITPEERLQSLKNITQKDVCSFYQKYFVSGNTKFVIAGSFSKKEMELIIESINKGLEKYKTGKAVKLKYKNLLKYNKKIISANSDQVKFDSFDLTFINPTYSPEVSPAVKVFYAMYNDGTFSRIYRKMRSAGLGYSLKTGYHVDREYSEVYVTNRSNSEKSIKLFELAVRELKNFYNGQFNDKEIERAKGYVVGGLMRSFSNASRLTDWYVADFNDDDDLIDPYDYILKIKSLKKADIARVMKDFIIPSNWTLSILGPNIKKDEEKYRAVLDKHFG